MEIPSDLAREAAIELLPPIPAPGGNCWDIDKAAAIIQSAIDRALKDYRQYHLTESCKQTKEILDLRAALTAQAEQIAAKDAEIERLRGIEQGANTRMIQLQSLRTQLNTANAAAGEALECLEGIQKHGHLSIFSCPCPLYLRKAIELLSTTAGTSLLREHNTYLDTLCALTTLNFRKAIDAALHPTSKSA